MAWLVESRVIGCWVCRYWDNMIWAVDALLLSLPDPLPKYKYEMGFFFESWMQGWYGVSYTPSGLAWTSDWGPLRNAANAGEKAASPPLVRAKLVACQRVLGRVRFRD